jgi:ATP-dependent helicase Lhr and Lhr-like helicase
VLAEVKRHRTTLIFHNTRAQAELFFHDLWLANEDALPIGIHHGSLSREQRERVEAAMVAGRCAPSSAPARSTSGSTGATWTS